MEALKQRHECGQYLSQFLAMLAHAVHSTPGAVAWSLPVLLPLTPGDDILVSTLEARLPMTATGVSLSYE